MVQDISDLQCDYLVSNLRTQLDYLQNVLKSIEGQNADCDYMYDSLKKIEVNLRQIRKSCICY